MGCNHPGVPPVHAWSAAPPRISSSALAPVARIHHAHNRQNGTELIACQQLCCPGPGRAGHDLGAVAELPGRMVPVRTRVPAALLLRAG